ncbi:hypothetical protein C8R47DRAFT_976144 [Mycena vitilis]|nr:hypothetical protein C8R47DRAFT_976144 [Mycena vitilis]
MSGPFIYSPHAEFFPRFPPPTPCWGRANSYHNSPFVPAETIYPSSPYAGPIASDDGAPNTPERHLFSGLNGYSEAIWNTPRQRRRRLSWAGTAPRVSPFIPPPPLSADRNRFWGNADAPPPAWFASAPVVPPYPPAAQYSAPPYSAQLYSAPPFSAPLPPFPGQYVSGYPQFPGPLQIHPWINGEAPSPEFIFDLSATQFLPRRAVGPDQYVEVGMADLQEAAFHPPVTKLRITCDMIPNWPIDLVYPVGTGLGMQAPPITLGDVLVAVHRKMHEPITHRDWARLSVSEEARVSRAFTRRCKDNAYHGAHYRQDDEMEPERRKGVKVVDFLCGRHRFRGLVRTPEGCVKLVTSE